ncbi:MAG: DUF692 domain-containing protein [Myxococcales bacterium]|nr:DUF692 domain-containing protein [Myxococcales bacterium]
MSRYGVGLRTEHYGEWLAGAAPRIDFVEAITENFATRRGRPWAVLEAVRRHVPLVFHGVSLSLGGADPIDRAYVRAIATLADRFEPLWISDHLCASTAHTHHAHDLWPLPRTRALVRHVAQRIGEVQDLLGRRILVENISSYVQYARDEMSAAEFVAAVVDDADCDLLLDVNNVVVDAYNHGFDPHEFLRAMPARRVRQLHLAGHDDCGTHLFDDHRGPIPDTTWSLFETAVSLFGEVPALVEWDKHTPSLGVVATEANTARERAAAVLEGRRAAS